MFCEKTLYTSTARKKKKRKKETVKVEHTCFPPVFAEEKPGGSGMFEVLEGRGGAEFRSTTHFGGGGRGDVSAGLVIFFD